MIGPKPNIHSVVWLSVETVEEMTIDLVFITYNRLEYTKLALASILAEPTNWLWTHAKGDFLSKVDDDCQMRHGILGLQFALPGLVGSDLNGIPKEGATLAEKLNLSVNIIGRSVIKTA